MIKKLVNLAILNTIKILLRGKKITAKRESLEMSYEIEIWEGNKARATDEEGGYYVFNEINIIDN